MSLRAIQYFDELDSTNAYCLREAGNLASETLVVARSQTSGRGRRGRTWHSPANQNFYGSLLLKPPFGKAKIEHLPQIAGLAVDDATKAFGLTTGWIKWPNDLYAGHSKLAGILAECTMDRPGEEALVVGLGVNLNMDTEDFARIDNPATSMLHETGRVLELEPFTERLYDDLIKWYRKAQKDPIGLHRVWADSIPLIGKEVEIVTMTEVVVGTAVKIHLEGEIEIELEDGQRRTFMCGDVSLRF